MLYVERLLIMAACFVEKEANIEGGIRSGVISWKERRDAHSARLSKTVAILD